MILLTGEEAGAVGASIWVFSFFFFFLIVSAREEEGGGTSRFHIPAALYFHENLAVRASYFGRKVLFEF